MSEQSQMLWSDYPLNRWMVIFTVILLLANINGFLNLLPYLTKTLFDWKANIRLESSVPRVRLRNFTAFCMVFPFCLLAGRYSFLSIDALDFVPVSLSTLTVFGVFAAYCVLKLFAFLLLRPRNHTIGAFLGATSSEANSFIILSIVELLTTGVLTLFGAPDLIIRTVLLYELAVFYLLIIIRKGQILASSCNPFSTFLYLCGLEFAPAFILIAANVKF